MSLFEKYPCKGQPYESEKEATQARYENYVKFGTQLERYEWICPEGHWHEGVLD